ncbi:hypothetical protein HK405_004876 [Cladochytrium tenue]|nr:hypothetical protein HK405_004876 [Cladochytrium tenue]
MEGLLSVLASKLTDSGAHGKVYGGGEGGGAGIEGLMHSDFAAAAGSQAIALASSYFAQQQGGGGGAGGAGGAGAMLGMAESALASGGESGGGAGGMMGMVQGMLGGGGGGGGNNMIKEMISKFAMQEVEQLASTHGLAGRGFDVEQMKEDAKRHALQQFEQHQAASQRY